MENTPKIKKSNKYLIIGVLVIFLALLGTTVAYYLGRISGNINGSAAGTDLTLTITKTSTSATGGLIPVANDVTTLNKAAVGYQNNGACVDKNGRTACQIYRIRLTNTGSVPLYVNGTILLTKENNPNLDCAKMTSSTTITSNASCEGLNVLASNETLNANSSKDYYIMVYVKDIGADQDDYGDFNGTVTFTTIDGKEVKGRFSRLENLVQHITNLYNNAEKTVVTAISECERDTQYSSFVCRYDKNNNIISSKTVNYNYATSVDLMNDRLGGTTVSLDGGNIRYYGKEQRIEVDNAEEADEYTYVGNWEALGNNSITSPEQCNEAVDQMLQYYNQMCDQHYESEGFANANECYDYIINMLVEYELSEAGVNSFEELCSYSDTPKYYKYTVKNYIDIGDKTTDGTSILYRIIGVFDGKIRVRREKSIDRYSFDTSAPDETGGQGINDWSQADLMKLLNPGYENNIDKTCNCVYNNSTYQDDCDCTDDVSVNNSLWWNSENGTCYNGDNNQVTSCDFTSIGLSSSVKDKIVDQTIYFGEPDSYSFPNAVYVNERNSLIGGKNVSTWTGKVALPYPSDFGYAVDLRYCNNALLDKNAYISCGQGALYACKDYNWMASGTSWTVTPTSAMRFGNHIYIIDERLASSKYPSYDANSWPVLTLDPTLLLASGTGTKADPYVIEGVNFVPGDIPTYTEGAGELINC